MNTTNPFETTIPSLEHVTEKYKFISTAQFIEDVQSLGYTLASTSAPRRGLGMHSMSFTNPKLPQVPGMQYRLFATNSHNGTSAFRLYVEMLVQVCSNGLVAFRPEYTQRVVHLGYANTKVAAAVEQVEQRVSSIQSVVNSLEQTLPSEEQTVQFLIEASKLRDAKPYQLADLQVAKHREQRINSAWNVYNRVQESLIRGGYSTLKVDELGVEYRGNNAKELTNIKERLEVNKSLWTLAITVLTK